MARTMGRYDDRNKLGKKIRGVDNMKRTEISIFDSIEDMEVFIAKNTRTIEVISITPNKYRKSYDSIYPSDYIMVYKNKEVV